MSISIRCITCKKYHKVNVTQEQLDKWKSGSLIQVVMPELSASDRELLITQICGSCFDNMFPLEVFSVVNEE